MLSFTLVTTVFNEINRLDQTIADIEAQTLKPDEIVVVDAGSNDGTYERLLKWKVETALSVVILQKPKCNVAEGRNLAIRIAHYNLIASTDFGCRFHPQWLESIIAPFSDPMIKVVGGAYTVIESDIQSLAARAGYLLSNGYQVALQEGFIPSSRSIAYEKQVWEKVGYYPEWLTLAADDYVFGSLIMKKGLHIHLVNKPYVYWGRHEKAISYSREAFRYGLGDGESHVNFRNILSNSSETILRYSLFVALIGLMVLFAFSFPLSQWVWLILVPLLPGLRSYIYLVRNWLKFRSAKYNGWVLLAGLYLVELTRVFYIWGYIRGYFFSNALQKSEAKKLQLELA